MDGVWRGLIVATIMIIGLFGAGREVGAQTCSGAVGVECGSSVCLVGVPSNCQQWGCGGGVGWEQRLDCSMSGGQCKVDNVCAQAGLCQYSIAGQCTSSGGGEETR